MPVARNLKPRRRPRSWESDYTALLTAVGALVIEWGQFERQLGQWTTLIFVRLHGARLAGRDKAPGEFSRKVEFLRKCFRRIKALQPYRDEALAILAEAEIVGEVRHNLVHGALRDARARRGVFIFVRLRDMDARGYKVRPYRLNLRAYRQLLGRFARLHNRAVRLSAALLAVT